MAARRLIWLAYGVFIAGFMVSAFARIAGRQPRLEDIIMSDLLSRFDNPRGYWFSAVAAVLAGMLLLPTVTVFHRGYKSLHSKWGVLGAWIYCVGLCSVIATGISTPFQQPYVPMHLYLAFLGFMSLVAGLAICHTVFAFLTVAGRLRQTGWVVLLASASLYLVYVFFTPRYFDGRRWFLALSEWSLGALICISTMSITGKMAELAVPRGEAETETLALRASEIERGL